MSEVELRKAIVNYRVLCDAALSERDDGFYTQEEYENAINGRLDDVVKLITDWHNKQVLEIIGEDESEIYDMTSGFVDDEAVTRNELRAEQRNKLKESDR